MRRALVLTTATGASALLVAGLACTSMDTIAKTVLVDPGHSNTLCALGDAGDGGSHCPSGQFCSKNTCTANDGICEDIESDACAGPSVVCGCDGITYYNDCVRHSARASVAGEGPCSSQIGFQPQRCDDQSPCKNGSCAVIVPNFCGLPPRPENNFPTVDASGLCFSVGQTLSSYLAACWSFPDAAKFPGGRLVKPVCDEGGCIDDIDSVRSGHFPPCCEPDAH